MMLSDPMVDTIHLMLPNESVDIRQWAHQWRFILRTCTGRGVQLDLQAKERLTPHDMNAIAQLQTVVEHERCFLTLSGCAEQHRLLLTMLRIGVFVRLPYEVQSLLSCSIHLELAENGVLTITGLGGLREALSRHAHYLADWAQAVAIEYVQVDMRASGHLSSHMINWLLEVRQGLQLEQLPIYGLNDRNTAVLRQMRLDYCLLLTNSSAN